MADLMRSLEIEFAPIARAKGLKLTFVPCSLPVESDRLLLRRLLQNFISNAIKYTPRGRVLVGCRRHGQSLQIGVYDTGVGIPVTKRGEIFKEFHRLEQGARIARGLGLGLSIVERLARVLNHGIAIDATASGGSVFSVTVPVAAAINHTAAVTSATPLSRTPMSGALIVSIENDPAILDGMKTLLTAWGAEVIAVTDPEAAIAAIESSGGSVTGLLVDYHLDRGNGVAAIREIRRRFGENIPAILITADRSPNVRAAAREENIAILNKPVKPASLRALLGQWRAQQMVAAGIEAAPCSGLTSPSSPRPARAISRIVKGGGGADRAGRDQIVMRKARPYSNRRDAGSGRGLNAGAGILERKRPAGRGARGAQAFQIRHWMRLAVRKLVSDDDSFEPFHDPKSGKHQFRVQARRVGHRHHGDIGTIRQGEQRHQTR